VTPPRRARQHEEKRWPWYTQIRDAVFAAFGMAILGVMAYRNSWPLAGVAAALTCMGVVGAGTALRLLLGRWEKTS
jgi:hypothetical protein